MTDSPPGRSVRAAAMLRSAGLWIVLACALLRCLVAPEPFPYWDIDPGRTILPVTGLTPSASIALDAITIFAGGAALLGEVLAGLPLLLMPVMLWILGCCGAAVHGLALRNGSVDDLRIGATWCAGMTTGLVAMHLCRDAKFKRMTLAAAGGIIAILAAKGAIQVFYEHALTVERYRQDKAGFLQQQGWLPDSTAVKNFERRLNQPEATGWFGLSNVYATFAAFSTIALSGCAISAWIQARVHRRMPDGWAGVLTLGAVASAGAVVLAGGKGGYAVAVLGLAMLGAFLLIRMREVPLRIKPRMGGALALGVIAAMLGVVICRGLIGTRVSELSLLFRWYYMQGAVRAFAETPSSMLWGTGPDGFRDAYMRLKPALSPEEVTSPHSVIFDWGATLGVFGLAWAGLWLSWVCGLGKTIARALVSDEATKPVEPAPGPIKPEGWYTVLAVSVAVLGATWFERSIGGFEQAGARVVGLIAWAAVSLAFLQLLRVTRFGPALICIGALAAAAHGQIEVTPIWGASTCWIALVLAAAGAPEAAARKARRDDAGMIAPFFAVALAGVLAWLGLVRVSSWEGALSAASDQMRPLAEIRTRMDNISRATFLEGDSQALVARDLAALTESPMPRSPQEFDTQLAKLTVKSCQSAAAELDRAAHLAPRHFQTTEALCRTRMEQAVAEAALGRGARISDVTDLAMTAANEFARRRPGANILGLIGNLHAARFDRDHDPAALAAAVDAWNHAAQLDPYGMTFPLRVFKELLAAGKTEEAKPVARKLLELNDLQRLDPLKMLTEEELKSVRRVLGPS